MTLLKSGNSSLQKSHIPEGRKNVFLFRVKKMRNKCRIAQAGILRQKGGHRPSCVKKVGMGILRQIGGEHLTSNRW